MLDFSEYGNDVVFVNAINKNIFRAKIHITSGVWSMSASLVARDGRKPA